MKLRLRAKYTLSIVSLIVIIVLILGGALFYQFNDSQRNLSDVSRKVMTAALLEQMKKRCESVTRILAENLVNPLYHYDMQSMFELLHAARQQNSVLSTYVYGTDGRIIHDGIEHIPRFGEIITDGETRDAISQGGKFVFSIEGDIIFGSIPIWIGETPLGGVKIGMSLKSINKDTFSLNHHLHQISQNSLGRNILIAIVSSAGLIVVGVIISVLLAARLTKPINEVIEYTKQVSEGNFEVLTTTKYQDEFGDLINSFSTMARDLRHHENELRKSHDELETRVDERTLELEKATENLQREVKDRLLKEEERRQLEIQLHQTQKMESLGTLAGGIAHDFNTLLGTIYGYSEIIIGKVPETSPITDYANSIIKVVGRAETLVNQIGEFSRPKATDKVPVNAISIIQSSVDFLRTILPATIKIQEEYCQGELTINANTNQINQLVVNLCSNASDFMADSLGTLTIRIDKRLNKGTDIDQNARPGNYMELSIRDTGKGIDPEVIGKIFDPFFTTKEVGKGSGLGLSIVHRIVENHEGYIFVDSEPGKGTSFQIFFPLIDESPDQTIT